MDDLDDPIANIMSRIEELEKERDELEEQNAALTTERTDLLRASEKYKGYEEQRDELKERNATLAKERTDLLREIDKYKGYERDHAEALRKVEIEQDGKFKNEKRAWATERAELVKECDEAREEAYNLENKLGILEADLQKATEKHAASDLRVKEAEEEYTKVAKHRDDAERRAQRVENDLKKSLDDINDLREENRDLGRLLAAEKGKVADQEVIDEYEEKLRRMDAEIHEQRDTIDELTEQIQELEATNNELNRLNEDMDRLQEDIQFSSDQNDRLQSELDAAQQVRQEMEERIRREIEGKLRDEDENARRDGDKIATRRPDGRAQTPTATPSSSATKKDRLDRPAAPVHMNSLSDELQGIGEDPDLEPRDSSRRNSKRYSARFEDEDKIGGEPKSQLDALMDTLHKVRSERVAKLSAPLQRQHSYHKDRVSAGDFAEIQERDQAKDRMQEMENKVEDAVRQDYEDRHTSGDQEPREAHANGEIDPNEDLSEVDPNDIDFSTNVTPVTPPNQTLSELHIVGDIAPKPQHQQISDIDIIHSVSPIDPPEAASLAVSAIRTMEDSAPVDPAQPEPLAASAIYTTEDSAHVDPPMPKLSMSEMTTTLSEVSIEPSSPRQPLDISKVTDMLSIAPQSPPTDTSRSSPRRFTPHECDLIFPATPDTLTTSAITTLISLSPLPPSFPRRPQRVKKVFHTITKTVYVPRVVDRYVDKFIDRVVETFTYPAQDEQKLIDSPPPPYSPNPVSLDGPSVAPVTATTARTPTAIDKRDGLTPHYTVAIVLLGWWIASVISAVQASHSHPQGAYGDARWLLGVFPVGWNENGWSHHVATFVVEMERALLGGA